MMTKRQVIAIWRRFADAKEFKLNPDATRVSLLADGVLENEKNHGLKYCPCRMTTGDFEEDQWLICPCNFLVQKTWMEKGECWCSLFVRR